MLSATLADCGSIRRGSLRGLAFKFDYIWICRRTRSRAELGFVAIAGCLEAASSLQTFVWVMNGFFENARTS